MFNADLKKQFLDVYTKKRNTRNVVATLFEATQKYEELYDADVCTLTSDKLSLVIEEVSGVQKRSIAATTNILREYVKWCISSGVPGASDSILSIKVLGVDKLRKQMVASPLHLQKYLDEVFDSVSDETIDIIYRCHCWMAFAGMDEKDTILVKCSDIDFNLMSIKYNRMSYPLYREALMTFHKAVELDSFNYIHPNYPMVRKARVNGDTVMRRFKADVNDRTIRSGLTRFTTTAYKDGRTTQQLSFKHIQLSGIFYRMFEQERAGMKVSFVEIASEYVDSREYKLCGDDGERKLLYKKNSIAKKYMDDYQRWKLAFASL